MLETSLVVCRRGSTRVALPDNGRATPVRGARHAPVSLFSSSEKNEGSGGNRPILRRFYFPQVTEISMSTSRGRAAACTVTRAGGSWGKYFT